VATFGLWLEQLVAESLGKDGTGVVPVVGEAPGPPAAFGGDRIFVITSDVGQMEGVAVGRAAGHPIVFWPDPGDPHAMGAAVTTAEVAVALAGSAIGVQPFDQPDVAAAKAATMVVLAGGDTSVPLVALEGLLAGLEPDDLLALQAFVDPDGPEAVVVERAATRLRDRHRVAVTVGYGPRFLHSTGQLHKGGSDAIVCVQVLADDAAEIAIPGRPFGFGHLLAAQAAGDLRALLDRGRRAGRVAVADLAAVAGGEALS
jgi:hypothetical protein